MRLNSNHPLWSWAAKHACWIMNRHQAYHRVTAIELVHGKQYTGSIVPFGCPVYAFVRSQALSPPKGDPKWKMTIFLGRTDGQAVWIVSDGERIMRTRREKSGYRFLLSTCDFVGDHRPCNTWEPKRLAPPHQTNRGHHILP